MNSRIACVGLVAVSAALFAGNVQADDAHVQMLERRLQQRDMVISELLHRVEALERRFGRQRPARDSAVTQPSATSSARASYDRSSSLSGKVVVDESEVERALERSLTRDGALLLRPGVVEIEPSLIFTRREDQSPTLLTSRGMVFAGETGQNMNSLTVDLALRLGLPWDSQLEMGLPYQWREVESVTKVGLSPSNSTTTSGAGAGDLRIGVAKTLLHEGLWRPDLVGRLTWNTGSGKSSNGDVSLGGGFQKFSGSLSAIKRQDPLAFVSGLSYDYYLEKNGVKPGTAISGSFGSYVAISPESSLQLQFAAGYQNETRVYGRTIKGSDRVLGTFIIGGSTLLAPKTLLNLSLGIGLTGDTDDLSVMLSVPIRFD